ncbi:MAG: sensor domain-containing protein [Gaiellales bacterium]
MRLGLGKLREAELHRLVVEHSPDLIGIVDSGGTLVFASPSHEETLGYAPQDLVGRQAIELVHPDDLSQAAAAFESGLAGKDASARYRMRHRDGHWVMLEGITAPVQQGQSGVELVLALSRDVTQAAAGERRLQVGYAVAQALAEVGTVTEAAGRALAAVCEGLDWDAGVLWRVEQTSFRLVCAEVWHRPDSQVAKRIASASRWMSFEPGGGLPGRVWEARRPLWIPDVAKDHRFPRRVLRGEIAVHSAAGFPVTLGHDVLGVIELFRPDALQPDSATAALMHSIGSQLGQFMERKRAEDELRLSEARKGAVVESALDCIVMIDHHGRIIDFNPAAEATFGYSRAEALGQPMVDLIVPPRLRGDHQAGFERYVGGGAPRMIGKRVEMTAIRANGEEFPVELAITRVELPGSPVFTAYLRDVTSVRLAEQQIAHLAYHDALTGLANREMLREHLDVALARADRANRCVAMLYVDLDNFKLVNDSFGHEAGDELLRQLAVRLTRATRASDLVTREGGDEFVVLLTDIDPAAEGAGPTQRAERVARKIGDTLQQPFQIAGSELYIDASIGISIYPRDAAGAAELLRHADSAMFSAKQTRSGIFRTFSASSGDARAQIALLSRLRRALGNDEFRLHYQPLVSLLDDETGSGAAPIIGVEALIRWQDGEHGLRLPDEFIPLAERTGIIHAISEWVLREVCAQARRWQQQGLDLNVAFNLSPTQLWQSNIVELITEEVSRNGLRPGSLMVEVTETAAMRDADHTEHLLGELHDFGLNLAIDDFGTGHSSLARLAHMPVNALKIDRAFVSGVPDDPVAAALVTSIIQLAHSLQLEAVAEGIETEPQRRFLAEHGCSFGQGYHFCRPVEAEVIEDMLA